VVKQVGPALYSNSLSASTDTLAPLQPVPDSIKVAITLDPSMPSLPTPLAHDIIEIQPEDIRCRFPRQPDARSVPVPLAGTSDPYSRLH
jgi:hypothetical protein